MHFFNDLLQWHYSRAAHNYINAMQFVEQFSDVYSRICAILTLHRWDCVCTILYLLHPRYKYNECICTQHTKVLKTIKKKLKASALRMQEYIFLPHAHEYLDRLINELLLQFQFFFSCFYSLSHTLLASIFHLFRVFFSVGLNREQMLLLCFTQCIVQAERMQCHWRSTIAYLLLPFVDVK